MNSWFPDLAAGGSDDWAKGVAGIRYSYTVELADRGKHGFVLPAGFIDPTGAQMFGAVSTLALDVMIYICPLIGIKNRLKTNKMYY